jgi:SulP family sulfate permease
VAVSTPSKLQPMPADAASLAELVTPKLVTALREGYGLERLTRDAIAGLTVAIIALPLSMGIAVAAGVSPERGLYTAIVGGFLISALGGSRFQVGGPAAAFIVVVYATIDRHGYDGLALATLLAGIMLLAMGALRLGTYIKYIPYPVTLGFTAGIGITIFVSQLADLLGLRVGKLPGDFLAKLEALSVALPTFHAGAAALAALAIAIILVLRRLHPRWPRFPDRGRGLLARDGCPLARRGNHRIQVRRHPARAARAGDPSCQPGEDPRGAA